MLRRDFLGSVTLAAPMLFPAVALGATEGASSQAGSDEDVFDVNRPGEGPHILLTEDNTEPWPGLRFRVLKDGYQVGGCIGLDSQRRTVRQLGFPGLLVRYSSFEEYERRVQFGPNKSFVVDGVPWDPRDHVRDVRYDAVEVLGTHETIAKYREQFPRHFIARVLDLGLGSMHAAVGSG